MSWKRIRQIYTKTARELEPRTQLGLLRERNYIRWLCGSARDPLSVKSLHNAATCRLRGDYAAARSWVRSARKERCYENAQSGARCLP